MVASEAVTYPMFFLFLITYLASSFNSTNPAVASLLHGPVLVPLAMELRVLTDYCFVRDDVCCSDGSTVLGAWGLEQVQF